MGGYAREPADRRLSVARSDVRRDLKAAAYERTVPPNHSGRAATRKGRGRRWRPPWLNTRASDGADPDRSPLACTNGAGPTG